MALFGRKYDKRTRPEDYIQYMADQLEHYVSVENKRRIETDNTIEKLTKELNKLGRDCDEMKQFIESIKEASNG